MGGEHADFSSQAGGDDAEDQGCNPGEHGAGVEGGRLQLALGARPLPAAAGDGQPARTEAGRSHACAQVVAKFILYLRKYAFTYSCLGAIKVCRKGDF